MTAPRELAGLSEIAGGYAAVLLDQFGVLHDGRRPFPQAAATLAALREAGLATVILSNSGKRAAPNAARLAALGFPEDSYDHLVTSGEACRDLIRARLAAGTLAPDAAVYLLSRDGDRSVLEGLPLREAATPDSADLVLIAGAEPERRDLDSHTALLAPAARRGVPCLCANPDLKMYTDAGPAFGAGAVARRYADAGGPVTWVGKPHPEIFRVALDRIGVAEPARALMVGDSVAHDIAGAEAAGCDWALVLGGLDGAEGRTRVESLDRQQHGYLLPELRW